MAARVPAKVLVVDDEVSLLETTKVILEASGFDPLTAATVPEAIALVRDQSPDALLADLTMPGDGRAVIAAMRQAHPHAFIVVITGHIAPDAISPDLRAQADEILFKPTNIPQLLDLLRARLA